MNSISHSAARLDSELATQIAELKEAGLHREMRVTCGRQGPLMTVEGRRVLMLAGANYLDLAADPRVTTAAADAIHDDGCASGGARLINGNRPCHEQLEAALSAFLGFQSSLLFSTGYMANLGTLTALAGPEDVILSDSLNHASIVDACRLCGAEIRIFRHNDIEHFHEVARSLSGFRRRIVVVDGVFSMDGDVADLGRLVPLAREYDMVVVVDDAHGVGVLGQQGRGTAEHFGVDVDVLIGNLGKAFGSFGAFVACSANVREFLVNHARPFIFTCGLPPASVAAALTAVRISAEEPERRRNLLKRARQLRDGLREIGYDTGLSCTHIVPAIVGDGVVALKLAEDALRRGVFSQAIRYPAVPRAKARLRFVPTSRHTKDDVHQVLQILAEISPSAHTV